VLIAAEAGMLTSQTIRANTGNVQFTPTGNRSDPTATHASLAPMVTMMDFMAARPESRGPFLPDALASEPGQRLRLVRLTRHPNDESCLQTMCQRMSCDAARITL
jgi:hypothetical protein